MGVPSNPLEEPIRTCKGVGRKRAVALDRLGVKTIRDALYLLPQRYEDRSAVRPIAQVTPGAQETVLGEIMSVTLTRPRGGGPIVSAKLSDGTGWLTAKWFNQAYLAKHLHRGDRLILFGRVRPGPTPEMLCPEWTRLEEGEPVPAGGIVPIYPLTNGIFPRWLRHFMRGLLDAYATCLEEFLPPVIRTRHRLLPLLEALRAVHSPSSMEQAEVGRRRLAFDDFFLLSVGLAENRRQTAARSAPPLIGNYALERAARERLGFPLTAGQERVLTELKADLARSIPMQRLLQGDVGSGKTAIALLALVHAVGSGVQGAIMVPTEVLAEQHFQRAETLLKPLGIPVILFEGSTRGKARHAALHTISTQDPAIIVGTHALIQQGISFANLGFIVIDEQHRFGVRQRARLQEKGTTPHTLVMTATPIPRTLALTVYGDLDLSILDEMPPGRNPVDTALLSESERGAAYQVTREAINRGEGAYVICPLIEARPGLELRAVTTLAAELNRGIFQGLAVGLLHGQLPSAEKLAVMEAFRTGKLQALIATTVVEVGVDIPWATVMIVEHAERLGLSQLHQLRGRVARSERTGRCFLIHATDLSQAARLRLKTFTETLDGFAVAELDLGFRGPGEILGTRQSGVPEFTVAQLPRDGTFLEAARCEAFGLVAASPGLRGPEHRALRSELRRRWRERISLAGVG